LNSYTLKRLVKVCTVIVRELTPIDHSGVPSPYVRPLELGPR